ncbi:MAG: phage terminase large subunit [Candidatus Dormibacteria bacterium]
MKKNFDSPADIPDCHLEWWDMCTSNKTFVAIAAPRGHAKSTAITHAYTLACILFRERSFALIISDTETQATFFLNDLKKELTENEDLMSLFGVKGLVKDSLSDFIIEFDDGHKARVLAKGSGQSMRGTKWESKRPDLIICDDLENDEIVMNKDRRLKFKKWFNGTLIPCRSKSGIVRVVGTILHMDSMLESLMPKEYWKDNIRGPLKMIGPKYKAWYSARYQAHNKDFSICLWPAHKGLEWLRDERQTYIDQGMADIWSQEYLNVPLDEERALFRRSDFIPMEQEDKKQNFNYYVGTDFALTLESQNDYCAFVIGGVNSEGRLHIVHTIHTRMQSDEIEETIFEINRIWKPEMFFFEKGQIWLGIQPHVINGMQERNEYFSYEALPSMNDKVTRSSAIRARMRIGAVKFDKTAEWFNDLEEECVRFPRGIHDDQVDALSLLGRGLNKFVEAYTDRELAEQEYEESKRDSGFFEQGRSTITGY